MQKMGMDESETIEHKMISASILRAQQKISERVTADFSAKSMEEWFSYSGLQNEGYLK
jgi:preprotein translocase subunit SecA